MEASRMPTTPMLCQVCPLTQHVLPTKIYCLGTARTERSPCTTKGTKGFPTSVCDMLHRSDAVGTGVRRRVHATGGTSCTTFLNGLCPSPTDINQPCGGKQLTDLLRASVLSVGRCVSAGRGWGVAPTTAGLTESSLHHEVIVALAPPRLYKTRQIR